MRAVLRTILPLLAIAGLFGAIVWSFWPQPAAVEVDTVRRGPLRVTVDDDGKTRIKERYVVSAPLGGKLLRIDLDPGDAVVAGTTPLATIAPSDPELLDARALAQAEAKVKAAEAALSRVDPVLERAQVELEFAKRELARLQQLSGTLESRAVSTERLEQAEMLFRARQQDYRAATFARDIAEFELAMARAALLHVQPRPACAANPATTNAFRILSPIDGRVLRIFQESATVVLPGTRLLELGDPSDLEIEVDVLSSDAVNIRPGAKASLEQWGGEGPLEATVRRVEPSAFLKISALGVEEQRVNVILDLNDPPERRPTLGDGFRVEARIVIWETDRVLQVPTGALFRYRGDWATFVVQRDRAVLRTVKVGHRNSLAAEVVTGLSEGDQVILHPSDKVRDGVAVRVRNVATP